MSLRLCKSCVVSFALALFMSWGLLFAQASQARVIGGGMMMDQEMDENLCALTFDDGPSIFTPQLLDMLKSYQIPATFFMLGQM
ncbi:MAG: polysaccharide deacetylase family protein, partial [Desulfovibrio sp.]|nr:polysaccharide deacetylase family protein [Desulfovibrio sp.]